MTEDQDVPKRRWALRGVLLGVTPLMALASIAYLYVTGGRFVTTENAYVKAEIITISANVDGQVTEVLVRDNQPVADGELLFTIDPRPFLTAVAAARAELANIRQRVEALRAQYRQSELEIASARERLRYLEIEHNRQDQLRSKGFGTQAKHDETGHALAMARRRLDIVRETQRMVLADLGGDAALPVEAHPLYLGALADLQRAELDLDYAAVLAPTIGTVNHVTLEAGEYVEAGDPLFALVSGDAPWVEANLKEVHLTHVEVGQKARIVVDSYPDITWEAEVQSISPATGAEFAILPPQNATGNWVKVVQRVPVRLKILGPADLTRLRAGMTAEVTIDTGHERDLAKTLNRLLAWRPD